MDTPSMYSEGNKNSMDESSQIRWCVERCPRCHSIFTVQILKDDIPAALKCMCCNELTICTENIS